MSKVQAAAIFVIDWIFSQDAVDFDDDVYAFLADTVSRYAEVSLDEAKQMLDTIGGPDWLWKLECLNGNNGEGVHAKEAYAYLVRFFDIDNIPSIEWIDL